MKKTWILLLIFFSAGILSYADAQSVKNLNTKEFKVQIWDFEKNKDWKYLGDKPGHHRYVCHLVSTIAKNYLLFWKRFKRIRR